LKNLTALVFPGRLQGIVDDGSTTRSGGASGLGKHPCFSGLADIANATGSTTCTAAPT
jgi:hypothetical protein